MILGALLAAGVGTRFDAGNKLLADLDGDPVVARSARTLNESRLEAAVAVVGHDAEAVARALPDELDVVTAPDYEAGQSASVRRAVAAARERDAEAILFALGDMPRVAVGTVEAIRREYVDAGNRPGIVAPRYDGRRGNPVLFDARYFDALARVEGDRGGRDLLDAEPVTHVDVADPGVRRDVDTERDLRRLRRPQTDSESSGGVRGDAESPGDSDRG